jgi:RNase P/RNase MRP subunit p29
MKTIKNSPKLLFVFVLLSILLGNSYAQESNEAVIVLKGKLIDETTKKPVIFANVYIANTNIGTVSNSEGEFIIKVPKDLQTKEIRISYMGYKTLSLNVAGFKMDENLLLMQPETIMLKELIVRTNDPLTLIKGAIKNIPENYGTSPYLCTAFYREAIMQNKQYVGVAEAVMDIYKSRYVNDMEQDRLKVFKGRKSQDVKRMDTLIFKLQGGHYVALLLDLAKNPQSFMDEQYLNSYDFKPVSIANVEGKETYIIEFSQKREVPESFYEGRLYLDVTTLAIKRAEFSISPVGLMFADKFLVKKKPADTNVKTVSGVYVVDYREVNGRWTLNHVRYEVKFKVDKKRQWFNKVYTSTVDMAITSKDTVNVSRFKYSESLKPSQIFVDHVSNYYDEDFWGNYNIIKPEEPIEQAIERISKKMKRLKNS